MIVTDLAMLNNIEKLLHEQNILVVHTTIVHLLGGLGLGLGLGLGSP